jgi:hypothetical protein
MIHAAGDWDQSVGDVYDTSPHPIISLSQGKGDYLPHEPVQPVRSIQAEARPAANLCSWSISSPVLRGRFSQVLLAHPAHRKPVDRPMSMNDTDFPSYADDFAIKQDDNDSSIAVLASDEVASQQPAEWTGPRCAKCNEPLRSGAVSICRSCGWYASLGTFLEVDPDWEKDDSDQQTAELQPAPSHLHVWLNLLPRWAWVIIASMAFVCLQSLVVRLATPAEIGGLRTSWSLSQLAIGTLLFVCCHVFNFLVLLSEDSEVGLLDVLLRPLKLWMRTAHNLPARLWLVNSAACGLTAAAMSLLVIGALPYERLWDWGIKQPVKKDLMGAIMDRAKQLDGQGADNLEEAIGDFAGKAGVDENEGKLPVKRAEQPRDKADCVILGYQLDREGHLDSLILGTSYRSNLVFAGKVKPELDDAELAKLLQNLSRNKTSNPFITVQSDSATWVKPNVACRVTYSEQMKGGLLRDVRWDTLLGEIGAAKPSAQ